LLNNGQLAGFGGNEEGQLGLELKEFGNYVKDVKINQFTVPDINEYDIWDIAAGDGYSLILLGVNLRPVLLRFGVKPEDKYKDNIEKLNTINRLEMDYDRINIKKVFAFGARSMLLTNNNDIYVGGIDFHLNPLDKYKFIDHFDKQIRSINLGLEHCLITDCI
jgi:hypothetical protein